MTLLIIKMFVSSACISGIDAFIVSTSRHAELYVSTQILLLFSYELKVLTDPNVFKVERKIKQI